MICPAFNAADPYAPALVSAMDCRVAALGRDGYAAISGAGGAASVLLAGLVTTLVGLTGYRLIFGERIAIGQGPLIILRIGLVLALATQWPAYQATIYDVVVQGPDELLTTLSGPAGGNSRATPARVQAVWRGLDTVAHPRSSVVPTRSPTPQAATRVSGRDALATRPEPESSTPQGWNLRPTEQGRASAASMILLVSSMAGLVGVRLLAAALLALGPLFIACALFDGFRGLFEGWIRALVAALVGSILLSLSMLAELAVIEPQVLALLQALVDQGAPAPAAVDEIFATACIFALILVLAIVFAVRVGAGFRVPRWTSPALDPERARGNAQPTAFALAPGVGAMFTNGAQTLPSRAVTMADSMRIAVEREAGNPGGRRNLPTDGMARRERPATGIGRRGLVNRQPRRSAASARRDRAS